MLLKYLLVVIIFYFIVKTSGNLMRAMRGELDAGYRDTQFRNPSADQRGPSSSWNTRGAQGTSRSSTYGDDDIEDAEWEDLDG
jgi:hypothetical protein